MNSYTSTKSGTNNTESVADEDGDTQSHLTNLAKSSILSEENSLVHHFLTSPDCTKCRKELLEELKKEGLVSLEPDALKELFRDYNDDNQP
jgi:hypothetical protein